MRHTLLCLTMLLLLLAGCSAKTVAESGKGVQMGALASQNAGVLALPLWFSGFVMEKVATSIGESSAPVQDEPALPTENESASRALKVYELLAVETLTERFRAMILEKRLKRTEDVAAFADSFCDRINRAVVAGDVVVEIPKERLIHFGVAVPLGQSSLVPYRSRQNPFGVCAASLTAEGEDVVIAAREEQLTLYLK